MRTMFPYYLPITEPKKMAWQGNIRKNPTIRGIFYATAIPPPRTMLKQKFLS